MQTKLYWITGLPGAGKTTIGNGVYYKLKEKDDKVIILDGDILKNIVGGGYSYEARLKRAKRYSHLCKLLVGQGMTVIICTIAMFEEVRRWNRENIEGYMEIFLSVDRDILKQRDKRGLYTDQNKDQLENLEGFDLPMDFPNNPDLVINNNGELNVSQCVELVLKQEVKSNLYTRDTAYWNNYYQTAPVSIQKPSLFAESIQEQLEVGKSIIDLGCGNGRDALFFYEKGLNVTGIDASSMSIDQLKKQYQDERLTFICDDFVQASVLFQRQYDYCYSRFTLHAINETQERELLENICSAMVNGGKLFIEARSIHDDIYGKGKEVGRNAYIYDGHYRRFLIKEELENSLKKMGFQLEYSKEDKGFSPFGDSDPTLIRIIAIKQSSV